MNIDDFVNEKEIMQPGISVVTRSDLLKLPDYSTEQFLDHLVQQYGVLLRGSVDNLDDTHLRGDRIYVSGKASIAIMKAIISNRDLTGDGLVYPYFIRVPKMIYSPGSFSFTSEYPIFSIPANPFSVKIHGVHDQTIRDTGTVYVVSTTNNFTNTPAGSWQHVTDEPVPIAAKIEIQKADFNYPVIDVDNDILICLHHKS
ncbi:MAG: hypothetical protein KKG59_03250 [Nanoarchaeota archaeon]|nr:hypothetical protein [Nanoarchaeota archaeon]